MIETRSKNKNIRQRYADVFAQCQDMAVIFSGSHLADLFEHSGAALLDFAERAENNSMQGRFFEAMGLIQRRRTDMENIFRREIDRGFENFGDSHGTDQGSEQDDGTSDALELSLVGKEEVEESVAAENLIIKANASFFPELYALSQRLAVVNDGKKLKDFEIPCGPHHLVHAFRHSTAELDVDVKIKVILFALFDKFVIKQAKGLYDELNDNLKGAGILPNLKPVHARKDRSPGGMNQQEQDAGENDQQADADSVPSEQAPVSLGAELFDAIIDLMSRRQVARHGAIPQRPATGAAVSSADLVAAVGAVQSMTTPESARAMVANAAAIPNLEIDAGFLERVKETLTRQREQVLSQVDRDNLSTMDADLIDLLGMLFEYMLNDPALPNLAKALLSHLHTPYLKVALIDRRLLVDAGHPSRQLFDQMVEAGVLWVDESNPRHGIFPAMQGVVDRVLQEFTDNIGLFVELLASFEQSVQEQQRKTDTMEQRTQEAARGREKLQLAKQRAGQEIEALLQPVPVPEAVTDFLIKTWLDQLVFILLRDKNEDHGDTWRQAVTTAKDLVALFAPRADAERHPVDPGSTRQLRERIVLGVKRMGGDRHSTLDALFHLLDAPETWQESSAESMTSRLPGASREVVPHELASRPDPLSDLAGISEQEQKVIERLRNMKFGTWFEFRSGSGEMTRRIKLSWLSPLTATCMFVDRSGMQAEIKTLRELAQEILAGRAKVIPRPKHPFIERALVSIRSMLQGGEAPPLPANAGTQPPQ